MKLIVLNLPRDLTEHGLADLFNTHGEITSHNLVMDNITGLSKGFGFVEMKSELAANAAIEALHGTKIKKSKIRVKLAN